MKPSSDTSASSDPAVDFSSNPLVPAVIVESSTGAVLMVGFMNEEAYRQTRRTGRTHFWSRSRNTLWKKGETSGHEQIVDDIAVNCELNSLKVSVTQIGAVCHDGYQSCYYRSINEDETLTVTMDRLFDPAIVYGSQPDLTNQWFGAYVYLRDQPLQEVSNTSRMLHDPLVDFRSRIQDELLELAGVLDGSHSHGSQAEDVVLEGSQSLYWLALMAVSSSFVWEMVRPDRALDTTSNGAPANTLVKLLQAEARTWATDSHITAERVHASMAIVAHSVAASGIEPAALIKRDIADLKSKPYLVAYFG